MFLWAMIIGTALGSTQLLLVSGANRSLGLSDQLFVLGDSVILTVLGQVRSLQCIRRVAGPEAAKPFVLCGFAPGLGHKRSLRARDGP